MAEIINLREEEYQTISTELANMHTEQLQNVIEVIIKMQKLVSSDDAFMVNHTSKKISQMLLTLSTDVITLLKQAFQDSEAGVASMKVSCMETDHYWF